ncbi:HEAT repeat-containing protein 6 [Eumeta japonica]|uniref:HEAT repeat-containing protein 6 n=1 Tax=Eumeta variegata TaxID=151549 RepID=A0A4C1UY75_EUMVA|nr:HEAT repeat-containing protein 6 [Eumeta japonica]
MDPFATNFSVLSGELRNILFRKDYDNTKVNLLIDELNAKPYGTELFVHKHVIIYALRTLAQLFFTHSQTIPIPLPELIGICRYYMLHGLVCQNTKPEKLMPSQQILATPVKNNTKGGKKQRTRKQRNTAIESIKKELPISDRSLMRDVDNFENNAAYKPVSSTFMEPHKAKCTPWPMTSDSDMSDVESSKEAKLIALKSRVRQSASNLMLVLIKVSERKNIFGFWWALLPSCPNENNWALEGPSKMTIAYCAVYDPIASSRTGALSVILALLSGSKMYLSQAESSKMQTTSFIPFSESLGYTILCMHKVLFGILEQERNHSVILVALKCCDALIQATPYHKMKNGLICELVRLTRKFLIHREVTLQVGALITMGCILSIDPKVEEVTKAVQKDTASTKVLELNKSKDIDECDDFKEGYSDDEMFMAVNEVSAECERCDIVHFKSWILDICFKNMGWFFKGNEIIRCKSSPIPVILESLQVISAIAFHHFIEFLSPHLMLLADILCNMIQNDHQEVVLQAARTVSVIGDAVQKLENAGEALPLTHCLYMWEKLLPNLSSLLQCQDNASAKAVVCDCIANIGERSFEELPRRRQLSCCALLVGSCCVEEAAVRAAAVRALAMVLMYRSLREDIHFVSDCGENILRALAESTLMVRTKAAWALGNLSDALVKNREDSDIEDIDDDLLVRLLEVSIHCAIDNDKIKMNATRAIGNLLRLIKKETLLKNSQIKELTEISIDKLLDCACKVANMKVRWNACYALGSIMKNDVLYTAFSGWQKRVFFSLCDLVEGCKILKVRITAATALRAPRTRDQYAEWFTQIWRSIMAAMEAAANFDDFNEYKHKDNLIEQLCVTLSHLCCLLKPSDLPDILDPLSFHYECGKGLFTQLPHKLPPENASCLKILEAAKHVTMNLTAINNTQRQCLGMLQEMFIWDL